MSSQSGRVGETKCAHRTRDRMSLQSHGQSRGAAVVFLLVTRVYISHLCVVGIPRVLLHTVYREKTTLSGVRVEFSMCVTAGGRAGSR